MVRGWIAEVADVCQLMIPPEGRLGRDRHTVTLLHSSLPQDLRVQGVKSQ